VRVARGTPRGLLVVAAILAPGPVAVAAAQARGTSGAPAIQGGGTSGAPTAQARGTVDASGVQARGTVDVSGAQARGTGNAPGAHANPPAGSKRAPSVPALGTGTGVAIDGQEEASASAQPSGGDPLAGNGLDSPLCADAAQDGLPGSAARDCRTSKFEGAQAPTGNYAFDVHIDDGLAHLGNGVAVLLQDVSQYWWTALVAFVRGLIVVLDWCFTIDLLSSHAMSGLARTLRATQATFTQPWLVFVLAIAAMLASYHGLIRRRVAETLGEALLMMAMMAGGLWVIVNPSGTIGALGAWTNEASLGTLAATVGESPDHPYRTLAESNQEVFSAAIDDPWCYMEFGEVSWCSDPARLDRRLRTAALKIAGEPEHAPGQSPALLRGARTNGELFLALPANEAARNSINDGWSLLHVLCGGSEEPCHGPTASEADFRNQSGTWPRVIGLGFISFGTVGMLLLFGFIVLRLLHSAIACLIYLLMTPAAVLAPALGEGGRAAFRAWAARLLGAVVSKLLFSFLLGAILMVQRVLLSVHLFGWFTQWLLVSSLWWIAYVRRHRIFELSLGGGDGGQHRTIARRLGGALESHTGMAAVRWAKRRRSAPGPSVERGRRLARAGAERAKHMADDQVGRSLEHEHGAALAQVDVGHETQARISAKQARLKRMRSEHAVAQSKARAAGRARESALVDPSPASPLERDLAAGRLGAEEGAHYKRAARLQVRMDRLGAEIAGEQSALTTARRTVREGESSRRETGRVYTRGQGEERARFLDAQAALPSGQRDHLALAGIAGYTRAQLEQLDPRAHREARLKIDRELATRQGLIGASADMAASAHAGSVGRRDRHRAGKELAHGVEDWMRSEGHPLPRPPSGESPLDTWKREGAAATHNGARRRGSAVLDDAREVAARRKRQLGRDRR
jgi:hypothetical protein